MLDEGDHAHPGNGYLRSFAKSSELCYNKNAIRNYSGFLTPPPPAAAPPPLS